MENANPLLRFFHPVLKASLLGKGPKQIQLGGQKYALFRDGSGKAAALADMCPHRNAPLSAGVVRPDGRLACPYHGWNFDAEGKGRIPSQSSTNQCETDSFQVVERHGYLWMGNRNLSADALPEVEWPDMEFADSFETLFEAPLFVALDNFSEDEHFPYIHSFFGWGEDGWPEVKYEFRNKGDHTEIHYEGPQRPSPLLPFLGVKKGDLFHNDWYTRFDPLRSVFTFHWYGPGMKERPFVARAAIFMTPETPATTRFHTFLSLKYGSAFLRLIKPIVRRIAIRLAFQEIEYDARFIPLVAGTSPEIRGMRLGKYDRGVTEHRKLLRSLYWPGLAAHAEEKALKPA